MSIRLKLQPKKIMYTEVFDSKMFLIKSFNNFKRPSHLIGLILDQCPEQGLNNRPGAVCTPGLWMKKDLKISVISVISTKLLLEP